MVKHIRMIAAACTAAILTLVGCSNINDATVSGGARELTSATFSVDTSNFNALLAPGTIKIEGSGAQSLYYKIAGESANGTKYPSTGTPEAITFDATTGKKVLTGIAVDDWTFTLYAYDDSAMTNLVLKGTTACAIKSGNASSVSFVLSSYGVTTTGGYDITIKYTGTKNAWDDTKYNLEWALYDKTTGELLNNTGSATATSANVLTIDQSKPVKTDGVTATGTGVTPGTYIFRIRVKSGSAELATAIDELVIEPGRKTEADFEFGDIIKTRPAAPATLQVQELLNTTYKPTDDYYYVRLYWPTSTTKNEDWYELIVKEFTDTSTALTAFAEDASTAISSDQSTLYKFDDILKLTPSSSNNKYNIGYVAGSLYAGNSELVLRLPTGRLFDFQIRAKNNIGASAATARTAATGTSLSTTETSSDVSLSQTLISALQGTVAGFDVGAAATYFKRVGVTQIKYALKGGTLYPETSATKFGGTVYTKYIIYDLKSVTYAATLTEDALNASFIPLMKINASKDSNGDQSSDFPQLTLNDVDCTGWTYNLNNVKTSVTYNVNGYKNIQVTAAFGATSSDVTVDKNQITIEELPTLAIAKVKIYYGTESVAANDTEYTSAGISVARGSGNKYITIVVTTEDKFAYYALHVNGDPIEQKAYADTSITFSNFSTADLVSGVANEIMVEAVTAGGQHATARTTITLTN